MADERNSSKRKHDAQSQGFGSRAPMSRGSGFSPGLPPAASFRAPMSRGSGFSPGLPPAASSRAPMPWGSALPCGLPPAAGFKAPMPRGGGFSNGPPPAAAFRAPAPPNEIHHAQAIRAKRPRVDNGGGLGSGSLDVGGSLGFSSPASGGYGLSSQTAQSGGFKGTVNKIEIPGGRAGVITGDSTLQIQSGARIQVMSQPAPSTKPVQPSGSTQQLINESVAKAEPEPHPAALDFEMIIPNNKRGLVIGKGGDNIHLMQSKSGASIKVVPNVLPPDDMTTETKVYIHGTYEDVECAKKLVNEVISEGYCPPRRSWGFPGKPPKKEAGHGYKSPGAYLGAPRPTSGQQAYSTQWLQHTGNYQGSFGHGLNRGSQVQQISSNPAHIAGYASQQVIGAPTVGSTQSGYGQYGFRGPNSQEGAYRGQMWQQQPYGDGGGYG